MMILRTWLNLLLMALAPLMLSACTVETAAELTAIEATLNDYLVGGKSGDLERLRRAFHSSARLQFVRDGAYWEWALEEYLAFDDLYTGMFEALRGMSKPSVAVVRGYAVAGGFTLAMGCDFVLAEQGALFGALEMRGGFPAAVNTALLSHLTGPRLALEFLLSARTVPATRLFEAGLINRLGSGAEDLAKIEREFISGLLELEPVAVKLTKETHRATSAMPLGEALLVAKQLNSLLAASGQIDKAVERFSESKKRGI